MNKKATGKLVRNLYPELHKILSRKYGARNSVEMLKSTGLVGQDSSTISDSNTLSCAFVWAATEQGHDFWSKVAVGIWGRHSWI